MNKAVTAYWNTNPVPTLPRRDVISQLRNDLQGMWGPQGRGAETTWDYLKRSLRGEQPTSASSLGEQIGYEQINPEPVDWDQAILDYISYHVLTKEVSGFTFLSNRQFNQMRKKGKNPEDVAPVTRFKDVSPSDLHDVFNYLRTNSKEEATRKAAAPENRYTLYKVTPAQVAGEPEEGKPYMIFVYETARAKSLGEENFDNFILNLIGEKNNLSLAKKSVDEKQALTFFFSLSEEDKNTHLERLKAFLIGKLNEHAGNLKKKSDATAPSFLDLARNILFGGFDKTKVESALKNTGINDEAQIKTFIAEVEGVVGNAAVESYAKTQGVELEKAMSKRQATPKEYEDAFNALAEEKGMSINLLNPRLGKADKNLAMAIHINSLPKDLGESVFHALIKRLGENGRLLLIFPRTSNEAQAHVAGLLSGLTKEEKRKVSRMPYVSGISIADIDRELSKSKNARQLMIMDLNSLREAVSMKNVRATRTKEFYSTDSNAPGFLTESILSIIVSAEDRESLLQQFPDIAKEKKEFNIGGFSVISFDLEALVSALQDRMKGEQEVREAA